MRRSRLMAPGVGLLFLAVGCGSSPNSTTAVPVSSSPTSPAGQPSVVSAKDYDPSRFDLSYVVDNELLPMLPGMHLVWEGHALDEGDRLDRRVELTITDMTKVIDGVRTIVAWEVDSDNGQVVETELAFFAQDVDGNVWNFGQYPEEYEDGEFVKAPAWLQGIQGAKAGLTMKAHPALGTPTYAQGWGPRVGWNDRAQAYRMGESACTPVDCFEDVLVIREYSRDEPNAWQLKFYAPGVGNVRVGWMGSGEEEREVLVLVEREQLGADALTEARRHVLDLEERAYDISKDVYALTAPMEPQPEA